MGLVPVRERLCGTVATLSRTVCVALFAQPCTARRADRKRFADVNHGLRP
jgi:hypothetical protein